MVDKRISKMNLSEKKAKVIINKINELTLKISKENSKNKEFILNVLKYFKLRLELIK
jgi:hypothetical protein